MLLAIITMLGTELNYHECIINEYESRNNIMDKTFRLSKCLKVMNLKNLAIRRYMSLLYL